MCWVLRVTLIFGEERLRGAIAMEPVLAQFMVRGRMAPGPASHSEGLRSSPPHDHVLQNHSVGRTRSRAASGPRLCTEIRTRMSSGPALAYSTNTSKYRSSLKTPVSSSSYFELLP